MPVVVIMGQEKKKVDYKEGMTVGDAIKAAIKDIPRDATITIAGKEARPEDKVKQDTEIIVTPKAKGG